MTDHDPMLDGITRYDSDDYDVELPEKPDGIYVAFSDLPALIAKVREDAVRDYAEAHYANKMQRSQERYEQGQRDEREAVAAMRPETDPDIAHVIVSDVLAAIDALLKEKS